MCCTTALITILSLAHITAMTISITLNAELRIMPSGATLTDLINQLDLDPRGVAIERNREIVPKSAWDGLVLVEGDRLELVVFVGGGL